MIDRLVLEPYGLPLRRPWTSARGTLQARRGWLVRVEARALQGFGDCAPLPEAGTETPDLALAMLKAWQPRVVGETPETMLERLETDRDPAPSARYALECAMLDLVARRDGIPLMRLLSPNAEPSVPINAALGPLDKVTPAAVATVCRAGFRVLKVKVGLRSPVEEIERLKDLSLHLCKGASLRLDANGAWTPEQAEAALLGFRDLPVESLEEPLHTPESAALVRLQANAPFPLALDEALHLNGREPDPATLPVRRMVIKPAVLGGVRRTLALASRAASAGVELVLTSVLESAAGIWSTAQLAAALPPGPAHGLATSDWLTRNLGRPPTLCNGRIQLPDCSGSGFQPEETDRL